MTCLSRYRKTDLRDPTCFIAIRPAAFAGPVHWRFRFCGDAIAMENSTRLLRQPTLSEKHIAFSYASDLWIVGRKGGNARRLTSTPAVESDPHFSPNGKWIAFTSNRSGTPAVYVQPTAGGTPKRLTWYPAAAMARGWTQDGKRVLYASGRATAPSSYERLWTVAATGGPSTLIRHLGGTTGPIRLTEKGSW